MNKQEKQLKFLKIISVLLLVLLVIISGFYFSKISKPNSTAPSVDLSEKAKPILETKIDKSFDFLIKKGTKDKFNIKIEKADIVKLVTAKKNPIVPKQGEAFLLIYLQIENNLTSSLSINTQNYFRLVDVNDKKFAPDFFNTAVPVAAISVKSDQIGFVVKEGQKDFKLQVGEIDGEKQLVDIKFE